MRSKVKKIAKRTKGYGKYVSNSWKTFAKKPNLYTLVVALASPAGKTADRVGADIIQYFSPNSARQLRKVMNENVGLSNKEIVSLIQQAGIKQSDLNNAAEKIQLQLMNSSARATSRATQAVNNASVSKLHDAYRQASRRASQYASKTSGALTDLANAYTGDIDLGDKYNSITKIIKEE